MLNVFLRWAAFGAGGHDMAAGRKERPAPKLAPETHKSVLVCSSAAAS